MDRVALAPLQAAGVSMAWEPGASFAVRTGPGLSSRSPLGTHVVGHFDKRTDLLPHLRPVGSEMVCPFIALYRGTWRLPGIGNGLSIYRGTWRLPEAFDRRADLM